MQFTEQQKSKLMVVVFLGVILLVVVGYFHFMLGRAQVTKFNKQADKLSAELSTAKKELAEIKHLMAQQEELEAQRAVIEKVVKRLPSSPDAPGFLMELVSGLRQTGIIQEFVKPAGPQDRSQYTEIPYTVEAFGRFHELGQFLTLMEQNPQRFMRLKSFDLSNNLQRPSIHPIKMEIATFMLNQYGRGRTPFKKGKRSDEANDTDAHPATRREP